MKVMTPCCNVKDSWLRLALAFAVLFCNHEPWTSKDTPWLTLTVVSHSHPFNARVHEIMATFMKRWRGIGQQRFQRFAEVFCKFWVANFFPLHRRALNPVFLNPVFWIRCLNEACAWLRGVDQQYYQASQIAVLVSSYAFVLRSSSEQVRSQTLQGIGRPSSRVWQGRVMELTSRRVVGFGNFQGTHRLRNADTPACAVPIPLSWPSHIGPPHPSSPLAVPT